MPDITCTTEGYHPHTIYVIDQDNAHEVISVPFQVGPDEDHDDVITTVLARHDIVIQPGSVWTDDGVHYGAYLEED